MITTDRKRVILILLLTFFLTSWLAVNLKFQEGTLLTLFILISVVFYAISKKLNIKAIAIDDNWVEDAGFGFVAGVSFIFLSFMMPLITIGYPQIIVNGISISLDEFFSITILAPIIEEIMFRGMLLSVLLSYMASFPAFLIVSIAFSLFHFSVYGQGMSSAFFGAFLFSFVACVIVRARRSLIPAIVMHAMFNTYLLLQNAIYFPIGSG